ncbi:uncharacterized protein LOC144990926 isoform X2 [Oryzias latipes]
MMARGVTGGLFVARGMTGGFDRGSWRDWKFQQRLVARLEVFGAPMGPGESSGGHMMPGGSMGSQFIGQQSYGDAVSKGYGQPVMYGRPGAAYNPGSAYGGSAPSVVSSPSGSVAVQLLQHDGQFLQPHFVVMRMVPKWCAAPGWLCGCPGQKSRINEIQVPQEDTGVPRWAAFLYQETPRRLGKGKAG